MLTAAQVAKAFNLGEPAGPLTMVVGSSAHRTWRLDTFGAVYFVKHYDRPWDMPTWSDWISYIQGSWEIERAAWQAGLAVAEPVMAPGAMWPWIDLDVGDGLATVRVHKWEYGVLRTDPATVPVAKQLGDFLGRTHRLLPGLDEWRRPPTWPDDWASAVSWSTTTDRRLVQSLAGTLPLLEEASARCAAAAKESVRLVRTHRDLHSHNVIERGDGRVIVVDWDAASTQRADWELVETAFELAGTVTGPPDRAVVDAFVSAYHEADGPARTVDEASFAGLLMCSQNWLRYNLRRVAGHLPGATLAPGERDPAVETIRSLEAVRRAVGSIEEWTGWFA